MSKILIAHVEYWIYQYPGFILLVCTNSIILCILYNIMNDPEEGIKTSDGIFIVQKRFRDSWWKNLSQFHKFVTRILRYASDNVDHALNNQTLDMIMTQNQVFTKYNLNLLSFAYARENKDFVSTVERNSSEAKCFGNGSALTNRHWKWEKPERLKYLD